MSAMKKKAAQLEKLQICVRCGPHAERPELAIDSVPAPLTMLPLLGRVRVFPDVGAVSCVDVKYSPRKVSVPGKARTTVQWQALSKALKATLSRHPLHPAWMSWIGDASNNDKAGFGIVGAQNVSTPSSEHAGRALLRQAEQTQRKGRRKAEERQRKGCNNDAAVHAALEVCRCSCECEG